MAKPITPLELNKEVLQHFSHPVSQCIAAPGQEQRKMCENKDGTPRHPFYPGDPSLLASVSWFWCDSPGNGKVEPGGWKGAARAGASSSAVIGGCCGKVTAPSPSPWALLVCRGAIPGRSAHPLPPKPTAALPGGYQSAQIG